MTIWILLLRQRDAILVERVLTLHELAQAQCTLSLRMRYNPDMRLVTMRFPAGTSREQVFNAFDLLTEGERSKLYRLPTHTMIDK